MPQTRDASGHLLAYLFLTDTDDLNFDIVRDGQGYVDRRMPATATFEQHEPQLLRVADVDLFGRLYHWHAVDHQGMSVIRHQCPPPAGTRTLPGYQVGHACGQAVREPRAGWLGNREATLTVC